MERLSEKIIAIGVATIAIVILLFILVQRYYDNVKDTIERDSLTTVNATIPPITPTKVTEPVADEIDMDLQTVKIYYQCTTQTDEFTFEDGLHTRLVLENGDLKRQAANGEIITWASGVRAWDDISNKID